MVATRASRAARALLAASTALLPTVVPLAAAHAAALQLQQNAPITVDARSSDFDYRNNTLIFQAVRIAQGNLAVEADEAVATGLNFEDSRWTFKGNVRITTGDGSLNSNDAKVQFAKNQIATAVITGGPASFEQKRDVGVARGRANRIEYDFGQGTVRLSDGAWLSDGTNEITGRTLVYSMKDQRVLATASEQDSQRVRITINPQQKPPSAKPGERAPAPKAGESSPSSKAGESPPSSKAGESPPDAPKPPQ